MYNPYPHYAQANAGFADGIWAWANKNGPIVAVAGIATFFINQYLLPKANPLIQWGLSPLLFIGSLAMMGIGGFFIFTNATRANYANSINMHYRGGAYQ